MGMRERLRDHIGLFGLAAAAIGLVIVRACLQSITIDEANTGLDFVANSWPAHWFPNSGNHVLNSALARLVTQIFGINELTLRTPAILGAIFYICSALCWCLLLTSRMLLQLPLFICLVYNPMVLDYLVAARGYSLATGLLFAALTLIAGVVLSAGERDVQSNARWASFFLALSFTANFSFAYVDAITMSVFFLWAAATLGRRRLGYARLAECCFLPGIVTAFVLCGPTVWQFPKSQLYFGSQSLREMWSSIVSAAFDELNPDLLNPWLVVLLGKIQAELPIIGAVALLALLLSIEATRWRSHRPNSDPLVTLMHLLVAIAVVTFLSHWLVFKAAHIPLPSGRTGLFLVLLWCLIFGAGLAVRFQSGGRDIVRSCAMVVLIATAVYFVGCLRLSYFREWRFDADSKQLYWIVSDLRKRCGITNFAIDWRYSSAIDFYRLAYANQSLPKFPPEDSGNLPRGRSAYVIFYTGSEDFIKEQKLQVLFHNWETAATVAIRGCEAEAPAR
jgi:hypothetical protein